MTCFWDSVIRGLHWSSAQKDNAPATFILFLKEQNHETDLVIVNHQSLKKQEKKENYEAIKNLKLEDGYLCSISDPVLCLLSEIFKINIRHDLNGYTTLYQYPHAIQMLHLSSSSSHCNLTKPI